MIFETEYTAIEKRTHESPLSINFGEKKELSMGWTNGHPGQLLEEFGGNSTEGDSGSCWLLY